MNCEIAKMIKKDILLSGYMAGAFILLTFLAHWIAIFGALTFCVAMWDHIADYRRHEAWHNEP